ncbi:Ca-activated chloride channel family protein [Amorphus suaedae]
MPHIRFSRPPLLSAALVALGLFVVSLALAATTPARAADAQRASILVLDASGSMWGQLDGGRTKIEIARDVLTDFFALRDRSVPLGVVAYGHNRKGDCSDIEVIASTGLQDPPALSDRVSRISPKGKTPLGQSLRVAASQIPRTAEEADIVLVTDGLETCGVDPCAVIEELLAEGIRVRAHVVGFGLTEQEAETLACIPAKTGGLLLRPQSGDELAESLVRTGAGPAEARTAGVQLLFVYSGGMPDSYAWRVREEGGGQERAVATVTGDARYAPYPVELPPGAYVASVEAANGYGEAAFTVAAGEPQDVPVTLIGKLPRVVLRDRGPYAAVGETTQIDLEILHEGQETSGAALALQLYRLAPDGSPGESITYSTVDGKKGRKNAGINLPVGPGRYLLRLETWGGEAIESVVIEAETAPTVTLSAPARVAPGAPIPVETRGSQLRSDRIQIWRGDERLGYGLSLGELADGNGLAAPDAPGDYALVYRGYDEAGEQVEKARTPLEVGAVDDDATGAGALGNKAEADDAGHGPDDGADGKRWKDYAFTCLGATDCALRDPATGLGFTLPAGWVATEPSVAPQSAGAQAAGVPLEQPMVEFYEAGGNLNMLLLNPRQWIEANGVCGASRAGDVCLWRNDAAPDDAQAFAALDTLRASLTLSPQPVAARCAGSVPCRFALLDPPLSGTLPPGWAVELPRRAADGRITTWFHDRDPGGNVKLVGLNQPSADPCVDTALGPLCDVTPYVSTEELQALAAGLTAAAGPVGQGRQVDGAAFDAFMSKVGGAK